MFLRSGFIVPQSKGQGAEKTSVQAGAVVSNGLQNNATAMPLKVSFTSLTILRHCPYYCIFKRFTAMFWAGVILCTRRELRGL